MKYLLIARVILASTLCCCFMCKLSERTFGQNREDWNAVPSKEHYDILQMLSIAFEANQSHVKTWQGNYRFEATCWVEGNALHEDGKIVFYIDAMKGSVFTSRESSKPFVNSQAITDEAREDLLDKTRHFYQTILLRDCTMRVEPLISYSHLRDFPPVQVRVPKGSAEAVIFKEQLPTDGRPANLLQVVDPNGFFVSTGGIPYGIVWRAYADNCKDGKERVAAFKTLRIDRRKLPNGLEYRISLVMSSSQHVTSPKVAGIQGLVAWKSEPRLRKIIVNSNCGFNVISDSANGDGGELHQVFACDYRKLGDAYLPSKINRKIFDIQSGVIRQDLTFEMIESALNEPIAESVFTHKQMSVGNGCRFVDQIENKLLVISNGELVDPIYLEATPVQLKPSGRSHAIFLLVGTVLVAGIVKLLTTLNRRR